jgi:hypothetical protein
MMTSLLTWCCLAAAAGSSPGKATDPPKAVSRPHPLAEAKFKAAREAYRLYREREKEGRFNEERHYELSKRLLVAQTELNRNKGDRIVAYRDHLDRMRKLEARATQFAKAGIVGSDQLASVTYFRIEAEIWLDEARGK